jgi:RNA polymerase sigma factor for flagellar operon FliA
MTERLAVVFLSSQSGDTGGIRDSTIADPEALSGPALVAQREISQKLVEVVDALPSQNRQLIRAVYFDGFTLQQAADRLGISKSWASRLHAKTLEQLARSLRKLGAAD